MSTTKPPRVRVKRLPVDRQGYDRTGRYWGVGAPLYEAYDEAGDVLVVRTHDKGIAKERFLQKYHAVGSMAGRLTSRGERGLTLPPHGGSRGYTTVGAVGVAAAGAGLLAIAFSPSLRTKIRSLFFASPA